MDKPRLPALRSIRRHLVAGVAIVALLAGGLGGWASTTEISGALIAQGALVVDSSVKKVQHPTGGVVGELRVRDGDKVKAGDIIVRLDETVTQANLSIVVNSLNELYARQARLEAERDQRDIIDFPESLTARATEPSVVKVMEGETRLFELRRTARDGQKAQLRQRIGQLNEERQGLEGQVAAKAKESELIDEELEGVRDLWRKKLVQIQRVTALERDAARLQGERGQLIAQTAQVKGKTTETELQIIQVDQDLRSDVAKDLREAQGKIAELAERKVAAEDQLKRIDIRAPQDGMVHQLSIHTVGGVVGPAEQLMLIVPDADKLTVEAKVQPQDIDQVKMGQKAVMRFTSFNQRTTPEINGTVITLSADITTDQRTSQTYYTIRIGLSADEVRRLGDVRLLPGMPVEAFIQTGQRTVMSYLVKPLYDQLTRAFREK